MDHIEQRNRDLCPHFQIARSYDAMDRFHFCHGSNEYKSTHSPDLQDPRRCH